VVKEITPNRLKMLLKRFQRRFKSILISGELIADMQNVERNSRKVVFRNIELLPTKAESEYKIMVLGSR